MTDLATLEFITLKPAPFATLLMNLLGTFLSIVISLVMCGTILNLTMILSFIGQDLGKAVLGYWTALTHIPIYGRLLFIFFVFFLAGLENKEPQCVLTNSSYSIQNQQGADCRIQRLATSLFHERGNYAEEPMARMRLDQTT